MFRDKDLKCWMYKAKNVMNEISAKTRLYFRSPSPFCRGQLQEGTLNILSLHPFRCTGDNMNTGFFGPYA